MKLCVESQIKSFSMLDQPKCREKQKQQSVITRLQGRIKNFKSD